MESKAASFSNAARQHCILRHVSKVLFAAIAFMIAGMVQAQTFSPTGSMTVARYAQTATLLSNGSVLVAGGCSAGGDCLSSADIYNPSTGEFTATGSMEYKRWGHTATLLPNGLVLIAGGCTGTGTCENTAELYNPSTGSFSQTGSMMYVRYSHQATLLNSGLVLLTGGCQAGSDCNATAELYDPNNGLFTATGSMESKRYDHTATLLGNGSVLIAGGCTGGGSCLDTAELYNPVTGTFSPTTGNMSVARYTHTATLLGSGYVLIAGGCSGGGTCRSTAELYNPSAGTFSLTGSMTQVRYAQTASNLFDGTVLISGGCESSGNCTNSAEVYNPVAGSFSATGSMGSKRYSHTATLLVNGNVLTAGGCTGGGTCLSSAELYNGPAPIYGYVSPKYLVIGVQYAPPGSHSNVTYSNSTMMGTSTTFSSSFTNAQTESISYAFSVGEIFGIFGNEPDVTYTATFSTGYTQETDSSNSISLNSTLSNGSGIPGPESDYVGVDHTYDIISVWLNPVLVFGTLPSNPNTLQLLSNTYDLVDPISGDSGQIDVVSLNLGQWLNPSTIDPSTLTTLTRSWEFNLQDGSSPGLTDADFSDIAMSDPFSNPNYSPSFNPTTHCSTDGRFCAAPLTNGKPDISYNQPYPGGQPAPETWGQVFQIMSSQTAGYKDTHTVGYSLDVNLTNGFLADWGNSKVDMKDSDTLTWTNAYSATSTNTTSQTANIEIVPPACNVPSGGDSCDPVYTGPTEFDLFEDTVYRSFMFFPIN